MAFDAQFNYCASITSSSSSARGPRVCNLSDFWEGWRCYIQAGQPLRNARCYRYYRQVQSLFRHQPRTVLSWLQSVTLTSANRHVWPLASVQVVYIVIKLSTSNGREGSLCWMTSYCISVFNGTSIGFQYQHYSAQFKKCGLYGCAKYALIKLPQYLHGIQ